MANYRRKPLQNVDRSPSKSLKMLTVVGWVGVSHLFHAKIPAIARAGRWSGPVPTKPPLTANSDGKSLLWRSPRLHREVSMKAVLAVATLALGLSPALSQQSQHTMVNATDVQWKEAPPVLPSAQISVLYGDPTKEGMFVMRLKFPASYRVPPHTHPVDEIVTVISGEFNIGMGKEYNEAQLKSYTAGGLIAMPPGTEHFVRTKQETVVQISTRGPWSLRYVNPEDKAQVVTY